MRHQQVGRPINETVHALPDGRRLVMELDQPAKVIDLEGSEFTPSSSEVIALLVLARMTSTRKKSVRNGLISLRSERDDDLLLAS
jgi:hypothetical protein